MTEVVMKSGRQVVIMVSAPREEKPLLVSIHQGRQ